MDTRTDHEYYAGSRAWVADYAATRTVADIRVFRSRAERDEWVDAEPVCRRRCTSEGRSTESV